MLTCQEAKEIPEPDSFDSVPADQAIVCVVSNPRFDAAAYCYSPEELREFKKEDGRPKRWLTLPREKAEELSGYKKK
jgi:hypothetical protein